jgi:hypothetical protein
VTRAAPQKSVLTRNALKRTAKPTNLVQMKKVVVVALKAAITPKSRVFPGRNYSAFLKN